MCVHARRPHAAFALVLASLAGAPAIAQVGIGITVESDYRFRGVSLSGGDPDAQLSLAWDGSAGAYAGASATAVALDGGPRRAALTGYAGLARRFGAGAATWDIGASATHFAGAAGYDYTELHGGVGGEGWNARLSFSPDYFGQGRRTLYAEIDAGRPLAPPWRVFAHLGALGALGATGAPAAPRSSPAVRLDARLGVALTRPGWELRAEWVGAGHGGVYPAAWGGRRSTLVLAAAAFF